MCFTKAVKFRSGHLWGADTLAHIHALLSFSILHTCCSKPRYSSCSSDILPDSSPNFLPHFFHLCFFPDIFSPLDRKTLHYWCGSRLFYFLRPPSSLSLSFRATKLSAGQSERSRRRFESRHAFNAEGNASRAGIFSIAMSCQALAGGTGRLLQHSTAGQSSRFSVTDWIFITRRPGPYEFIHFFFSPLPPSGRPRVTNSLFASRFTFARLVCRSSLSYACAISFFFFVSFSFISQPSVSINNCRPQPCPQTPH